MSVGRSVGGSKGAILGTLHHFMVNLPHRELPLVDVGGQGAWRQKISEINHQ